ncbi:hypothetical protein QQX98_006697 [Neonectria punicea]|uniref:Alpha/beta hydrolase fold-3 domain-containing protein n=1 Tax=Neonectria punicea TaxID=979145 RepID=A0ABR1GZZ4_9HYPO
MASTGPREPVDPADRISPKILAKLDPDFVSFWAQNIAPYPAAEDFPVEEFRNNPEKFDLNFSLDTTATARVISRQVKSADGFENEVKVYYPDPKKWSPGPYGVNIIFHGGGFVLGDLTTEAPICVSMRDGAGIVVIDVDYRHCPEHQWGKCFEDAWAALLWFPPYVFHIQAKDQATELNIKPDSISISGNSAGAHICLVLQHLARDAGVPLRLCLATVPPSHEYLTYKTYTESPYPSFIEFSNGPVLPWKAIQYYQSIVAPTTKLPELRRSYPNWWFAPIQSPRWDGMCKTLIRTAECDPLRDEGEAYAKKHLENGVEVTLKRYLGMPHTFVFFEVLSQKKNFDQDTIIALKTAHSII